MVQSGGERCCASVDGQRYLVQLSAQTVGASRRMSSHRPSDVRIVDLRWLLWGGTAGTVITASLAAAYWIFDASFGNNEVMLWPTSYMMMAFAAEPAPVWFDIALVWTISALSNIALYAAAAALLSVVSYPIRRLSSSAVPDEILLTVLSNGEAAQGLIVGSELIMDRKNNYTCLHGPSDSHGSIQITASDLEAGIQLSLQVGLMDHARIDHFSGVTTITPLNRDGICHALQGYETWSRHCNFPSGYVEMLRMGKHRLQELSPSTLQVVVESHSRCGLVVVMSSDNNS